MFSFIKLKTVSPHPVVKRHVLKRKENMKIVDYLDARLISFLDVETRDEAIDCLID